MTGTLRRSIIIADDDKVFNTRLSRAFEDRGYEVFPAYGVGDAQALLSKRPVDQMLLDLRMSDGNGLAVLKFIQASGMQVDTVILTGYGSIATALEAVRLGAKSYLVKPVDVERMVEALNGSDSAAEGELEPRLQPLAQVELDHIERVLLECDGNITRASRVLGIHRRSLQRKLSR